MIPSLMALVHLLTVPADIPKMTAANAKAMHECNVTSEKLMKQRTWGVRQSTWYRSCMVRQHYRE